VKIIRNLITNFISMFLGSFVKTYGMYGGYGWRCFIRRSYWGICYWFYK